MGKAAPCAGDAPSDPGRAAVELPFEKFGPGHGLLDVHEMKLAGAGQAQFGCGGGGVGDAPDDGEPTFDDGTGNEIADDRKAVGFPLTPAAAGRVAWKRATGCESTEGGVDGGGNAAASCHRTLPRGGESARSSKEWMRAA